MVMVTNISTNVNPAGRAEFDLNEVFMDFRFFRQANLRGVAWMWMIPTSGGGFSISRRLLGSRRSLGDNCGVRNQKLHLFAFI
jgi:hypothetical protein